MGRFGASVTPDLYSVRPRFSILKGQQRYPESLPCRDSHDSRGLVRSLRREFSIPVRCVSSGKQASRFLDFDLLHQYSFLPIVAIRGDARATIINNLRC